MRSMLIAFGILAVAICVYGLATQPPEWQQTCMDNLRNIGGALNLYAQDWNMCAPAAVTHGARSKLNGYAYTSDRETWLRVLQERKPFGAYCPLTPQYANGALSDHYLKKLTTYRTSTELFPAVFGSPPHNEEPLALRLNLNFVREDLPYAEDALPLPEHKGTRCWVTVGGSADCR